MKKNKGEGKELHLVLLGYLPSAVLASQKAPGLSIVERLRGTAGGDQPSWPASRT